MKNLINNCSILSILLLVFSCNKNFWDDSTFISGLLEAEPYYMSPYKPCPPIVISPDWLAKDYIINREDAGNAKYTMTHVPSWLKISSLSGRFTDDFATLNCKADHYDLFSKIGYYWTYILMSIEGKKSVIVPVAYIVEGNPVFEIQSRLDIDINRLYNGPNGIYDIKLPIKNTGNGILVCSVSELPEWLSLYSIIGNTSGSVFSPVSVLTPNEEGAILLSHNSNFPFLDVLEKSNEKIIVNTNDKNQLKIEVEVQIMDLGSASLGVGTMNWRGYNKINFGQTETWKNWGIDINGDGFLVWKIEGCPEWLIVNKPHGISSSYESLTFTCHRELLSPDVNTATIYLKTNDKNNPSYLITVTAIN